MITALAVTAALASDAAAFQSRDYLPLSKAELGKPFPLTHVADSQKARTLRKIIAGVSGIAVTNLEGENDEEISGPVFSGKDRQGKPWSVRLGEKMGLGGDIFTADLDRNGIRDVLMIFPTGGNGLAPSSHILALMFDSQGRPVPFEAEGYYDSDSKSILELVDLNRDGKAELVFMNFDDGYWITNIYTVSDARWRRIRGRFASRSFPLYTRFTNRPNRVPVAPARERKPFAPDLSNNAPLLTGRLLSFTWAKEDADENDFSFVIEDLKGARISSDPDDWFTTTAFVFDGADGRQIVSPWADKKLLNALLEESIKAGYKVSLYGRRSAKGVSPELVWVTK